MEDHHSNTSAQQEVPPDFEQPRHLWHPLYQRIDSSITANEQPHEVPVPSTRGGGGTVQNPSSQVDYAPLLYPNAVGAQVDLLAQLGLPPAGPVISQQVPPVDQLPPPPSTSLPVAAPIQQAAPSASPSASTTAATAVAAPSAGSTFTATASATPPIPAVPAAPSPAPSTRPTSGPGSRQRWTPAEDAELVKLVKQVPPLTWTEIGEKMGRKGGGCGMRWYKVLRARVETELAAKAASASPAPHESASTTGFAAPFPSVVQPVPTFAPTPLDAIDPSLQPSRHMVVGSSSPATAVAAVASRPTPTEGSTPKSRANQNRRVVNPVRTGIPMNVLTTAFPPVLPPSANKAGHPYPLPPPALPDAGTSTIGAQPAGVHANSGPHYLPDAAMVANPPVPFSNNTVLRGRRTKAIPTLKAELEAARTAPPPPPPTPPAEGEEEQPRKKVKKRGNTVHVCPAENCGAAFKRSEHLRRHYKSVHRGEKPWPCQIEGCGKSFSRKDNLQQHQALIHLVRASYHYPDGTVTADPPSPSSAANVTTTFEAVEINRTNTDGTRPSRARKKAPVTVGMPRVAADQTTFTAGQQPGMSNEIDSLLELSSTFDGEAGSALLDTLAGSKRPLATGGDGGVGAADKRPRLDPTSTTTDQAPPTNAGLDMLAVASSVYPFLPDIHDMSHASTSPAASPRASSGFLAFKDSPKPPRPEGIPFPAAYDLFMHPVTPLIFSVIYFATAKTLSHYQNGRNRIKGRGWDVAVVAHNLFLALYSAWTFVGTAPQIFGAFWRGWMANGIAGLAHAFCDSQLVVWGSQTFPRYTYIFYLSKYYEIMDTAILLLKGKKVGMLQSYHHAGAVWTMFAGYRAQAMPIWLFCVFNSFVHSI
ncbi:hypothetical protein JCM11641_002119, partial [Rhodosporidiobolus odoratus]